MQEEIKEKDDIIYEIVAQKLEEKCQERHAHEFYEKLQKTPSLCQKLNEIANQKKNKNLSFQKFDMDLGKMQTLALDFFNLLDEELCERVWRVLEDTEYTILHVKKPSEKEGDNSVGLVLYERKWKNSTRTLSKTKVEISLAPRNDTEGLLTVAHEFAHTMEECAQKRISPKTYILSEVVPLFMEKIYADYLVKIGKIDQNEREKLFLSDNNLLIGVAKILTEELEIFRQLPSPIKAKDLKAFDKKYIGSPRRKVLLKRIKTMIYGKNGEECYGEIQFRYVIGELVSRELYKDFQKDPRKTIEKLKNFAQTSASISASKGFEMLLGENCYKRLGLKIGKTKK